MARYADIRPQIKSGDILAWSHRGVRSWYDFKVMIVRMLTMSEYSHVGVAWCVGERVFILESVVAGVRIFPLSLDVPFFLLRWRPLTEAQLEFALSKAGQRYSYWECAKAYFRRLDRTNGAWECAEYVCAVLGLDCAETPTAVVNYALANDAALTAVSMA